MTGFCRHDLIRADPALARAALAQAAPELDAAFLDDWVARDLPFIVRARCTRTSDPDMLPVGLPLPPALGKGRLALSLPMAAVRRGTAPPRLAEAGRAAPPGWQDTIRACLGLDPEVRCFGSLAWHYLTGLPYLTPRSDLDLLWHPADAAAGALIQGIERLAAVSPVAFDGEIVAPDGGAVQWRELASGQPEILVKHAAGPVLRPRAAFMAAMAPA